MTDLQVQRVLAALAKSHPDKVQPAAMALFTQFFVKHGSVTSELAIRQTLQPVIGAVTTDQALDEVRFSAAEICLVRVVDQGLDGRRV